MSYKIGIFDSGVGGLTVFNSIFQKLPNYHYIYLGDNARAPYGNHSYDTVLQFTWESVRWLLNQDCQLVIVACNTASAKALRTIQQKFLPSFNPFKRVLGVIRPTAEKIGNFSFTKHVGLLATTGTINSESYDIEINKFFPDIKLFKQACPLLVPLIENQAVYSEGGDFFINQYVNLLLNQHDKIDTILLGCTHYPLISELITKQINKKITLVDQGYIVADSLVEYLQRHPEINNLLSKYKKIEYFTTDDIIKFKALAKIFTNQEIEVQKINLV